MNENYANSLTYVEKVPENDNAASEKVPEDDNSFQIFNFNKSKLLFGAKFDLKLNAQFIFSNHLIEDADILLLCNRSFIKYSNKSLVAYLVSDNSASQETKVYIRKWHMDVASGTFNPIEINNTSYEFLNKKSLRQFAIKRYEIIAFGLW